MSHSTGKVVMLACALALGAELGCGGDHAAGAAVADAAVGGAADASDVTDVTDAADAQAKPPRFDTSGNSPCKITDAVASCASKTIEMIGAGDDPRRVFWNQPVGTAPAKGWPAVILYQGTNGGPQLSWDVDVPKTAQFGGYFQVSLIALLLDNGFVVVQPEAAGGMYWSGNIPGSDYATSKDAAFIPALLAQLQHGIFGKIDMQRLYATGISSGGYMTSRMAVSYPGKFRALAIESASYATCLGPICTVPSLPKDYPPTLFLHGGMDNIVPIATARAYYDKLVADGAETKFIEDDKAGHQWLDTAPQAVTSWFMSH